MNVFKIKNRVDEIELGTEDAAFRDGDTDKWWWQCRGSADCNGPFDSLQSCREDYDAA